MKGSKVVFTYAKPKTLKFINKSVTLKLDGNEENRMCSLWGLLKRTPANTGYKTTFTCDKEGIIELSETGWTWALKKGTVTVTATSGDKRATIKVIVK